MRLKRWRRGTSRMAAATLVALTIGAARSAAQDSAHTHSATVAPSYRSRILGVFDAASGQPVTNADVTDLLTGVSATTNRGGTVALTFLPEGGGLVRIRKVGYAMQTIAVAISAADTAPITVVLTPAIQLPGVTTYGKSPYISPNLRGFEERREHAATGQFITDSVLRREENLSLANVLRSHLTSINIVPWRRKELLRAAPSCHAGFEQVPPPPDVYVDGVPLAHPLPPPDPAHPGGNPSVIEPFDLGEFSVTDLAGVEYYPETSMAPLQFSHTSRGCGVLLLWTREK